MTGLLAICVFVIVFGLNLKVISKTLDITAASTKEVKTQLTKMGLKIVYASIPIIIVGGVLFAGIAGWGFQPRHEDGTAIASMGLTVLALGFTTIIRARGRPKEVLKGARIVIWVGVGFFLFFVIAYLAYLIYVWVTSA
ncbi:MAG: hypothetical protein FJ023_01645 [Chloroflexi bacterium]|nr:hypothetical protein [Chloroflexota bacterium]